MTVALIDSFKSFKAITATLISSSTSIVHGQNVTLTFKMNTSHATGTVTFNVASGQIFNAGPLSSNITANFTNVNLSPNNVVNYSILINQN